MPLLENGRIVADDWVHVPDDAPCPADVAVIVSFARVEEALARPGAAPVGVRLNPDTDVATLNTVLPRLGLVNVDFPGFRDGRAFTQARALREHLHFTKEIRATGHALPDQYEFMLRCGITTVEIAENADPSVWEKAHTRFTVAYQPSVLNEKSQGFGLRRFLDA
ncbi:DUF934 domain-containing protein [Novacetimonas hansenii]|uniref:DUF934 domain-containing protein n=1 Tax=Novacetimonas hansenii TaxID=436 RepID=A0AAW5END4_NOVHA|nr:DUF934 domain-containing protein [Novacetimonas hansenii]MCJ8352800.1 DUF934 domain-containing protein [Novacetimonas hansenii]